MSGRTVIVTNSDRQYSDHPMAEVMGCTNFRHGKKLKNGDTAKVIHVHKMDVRIYVLEKHSRHYLIGTRGIQKQK